MFDVDHGDLREEWVEEEQNGMTMMMASRDEVQGAGAEALGNLALHAGKAAAVAAKVGIEADVVMGRS